LNPGTKISVLNYKDIKKIGSIVVAVLVIVSLVAWTLLAPGTLSTQTSGQISRSLFQVAKTERILNITDGEGSYSFLFGLDYNESASPGVPTIIEAFASLVGEQKTSGFLKGVALQIDSSSVLIDGIQDSGVSSMISSNGDIIIDRLSGIDINETAGVHQISARLIVSTLDVNYIGYFGGSEQVLSLNGSTSVT
jgi:hypothetical protein